MTRWLLIGTVLSLVAWPSGAAGTLTMRVSPAVSQGTAYGRC